MPRAATAAAQNSASARRACGADAIVAAAAVSPLSLSSSCKDVCVLLDLVWDKTVVPPAEGEAEGASMGVALPVGEGEGDADSEEGTQN
jgi:hypothetical protein